MTRLTMEAQRGALIISRPTASRISTPIGSSTSKKSNESALNERPPVDETWEVFSDLNTKIFLSSARTQAEYETDFRYSHARLALIARGLRVDELKQIFEATSYKFIRAREDHARNRASKASEDTMNGARSCSRKTLCLCEAVAERAGW